MAARRDGKRRVAGPGKPPSPATAMSAHAVWGVVATTALVFLPVLGADFVAIDDRGHIVGNVHFQSGSPFAFLAFWQRAYFGLYIPVSYTVWSFAALLSRALTSTLHPAVFHGLNLLVHLANVGLVYRLLCRVRGSSTPATTTSTTGATLGAALFALHPTQVESVAWASELRGLLAMGFGLYALLVALGDREEVERAPPRRAAIATALFVCAMLSKPTAVALPLVLIVLERMGLGRGWKRALPLPLTWAALGLGLAMTTKALQPDVNLEYVPALLERPLIALDALTFYAWKTIWPSHLAMDYGRTPTAVLEGGSYGYTCAVALLALAAAAWAARSRPWVACAVGLFVAPLVPVLGLVPFEFQDISTVADRYLYPANLGIAYAAMIGYDALAASAARKRWSVACALGLFAAVGLTSHLQARTWHDSETLFGQALEINPRSFGAHHGLASHFFEQGRFSLAYEHCKLALAAKPDYLPAQKGLADALAALGDADGAVRAYLGAVKSHAGARGKQRDLVAETHADLAVVLHRLGDTDGAIAHLREAVELRPDLDIAHRNLARLLLSRGDRSGAIAHFRSALAANPYDAISRRELDSAAGQLGHSRGEP